MSHNKMKVQSMIQELDGRNMIVDNWFGILDVFTGGPMLCKSQDAMGMSKEVLL